MIVAVMPHRFKLLLLCAMGSLALPTPADERPAPAPLRPGASATDPSTLLADPRFQRTWRAAVGAGRSEPWIVKMDGPAPAPRWVMVAGNRYVLNAFCKAHDCHDNNAVQLYNPYELRIYGLIHRGDRNMLIGNPPPEIAAELQRQWQREWRQPSR